MRKNFRPLMLISALCSLAACGSAPDDKDVQQAMRKHFEKAGGKGSEKEYAPLIETMKIVECKKNEVKAYECAVKTEMGLMGYTLAKGDDGWVVTGPAAVPLR